MQTRRHLIRVLALVELVVGVAALAEPAAKTRIRTPASPRSAAARAAEPETSWVLRWNQLAIDASGADHAGAREQLGPGRSSRALAIVHIAMFDALNALVGGYESYTALEPVGGKASAQAALAEAAHDTLAAMFPAQAASFAAPLAEDLEQVKNPRARDEGARLGHRAAEAILTLRANDGSDHEEPLVGDGHSTSDAPGAWRPDPISQLTVALGAHWGEVTPFVLASSDQFRAPPPPTLTSPAYTAAYNEVLAFGGATATLRTKDQTEAGIYWAYDGTPSLCAPPRLYNQIAVLISQQMGSDAMETLRLLTLVNTALADAGTAIWESKYHWDVWRPVTGIRESDQGTGPSGLGDGNDDTAGDPTFSPLGAPASNVSNGVNFTPPFPAYPSGHAGFGGALFQTLRRFYGTDEIAFTFVSDEYDGVTRDKAGHVRPLLPRSFDSLSEAEEENGQSRIYLGIHWAFDKTAGVAQGRAVADWVFDHAFRPLAPAE